MLWPFVLADPQNPSTAGDIERLRNECAEKELLSLLGPGSRMTFGTAGLRAKMGAGYCYMNDLTVIQTAQVGLQHLTALSPHCCTLCTYSLVLLFFLVILLHSVSTCFQLLSMLYWVGTRVTVSVTGELCCV